MTRDEHLPGEPATRAGLYEELNVFGSPTGNLARLAEGAVFPAAPRGFTWRVVGGGAARIARAEQREREAAARRQRPAPGAAKG